MAVNNLKVVLDTNIICSLCRGETEVTYITSTLLYNSPLQISLDSGGILQGEYQKNVRKAQSSEYYQKWFQQMEAGSKIFYCFSPSLTKNIDENLTRLKFTGKEDKVIVALALNSGLKYIVTEDSDFGKGTKGKEHLDAYNYLSNSLGITIHDKREAVERFIKNDF